MPTSPARPGTADLAEVLELRRWARQTLCGATAAPPDVAAGSWALFLDTERCAVPLLKTLGQSGGQVAAGMLTARSITETQRMLSAKGQLDRIAAIALAGRWPVAVLKGGLPIATGDGVVDLHDLDLLVAPQNARPLADALAEVGYRVAGTSSVRHLEGRMLPESIPVEIHWSVDPEGAPLTEGFEQGMVPLAQYPGLFRLPAAEQLWSILLHLAIDHPDRRSNLRDQLLAAGAWSACTALDLDTIAQRAAAHASGDMIRDLIDAAAALANHRAQPDQFESLAATVYFLRNTVPRFHLPERVAGAVADWVLAIRLGPAERSRLRWRITMDSGTSALPWLARLERQAPAVGRVARVTERAVLQVAGFTLGAPLSLLAERAMRRALAQR